MIATRAALWVALCGVLLLSSGMAWRGGAARASGAHVAVTVGLQLTSGPTPQITVPDTNMPGGKPANGAAPVAGSTTSDLTKGGKVVLRPDQYAYFVVTDFNPILYSYNVTSVASETDSAKAIDTFEKAIASFGKAAGGGAGGGAAAFTCLVTVNGVDVYTLANELNSLDKARGAVVDALKAITAPGVDLATTAKRQQSIINGRLLAVGDPSEVSKDLGTLNQLSKSLSSGAIAVSASCTGGSLAMGGSFQVTVPPADSYSGAAALFVPGGQRDPSTIMEKRVDEQLKPFKSRLSTDQVRSLRTDTLLAIQQGIVEAEHLANLAPDALSTLQKITAFASDLGRVGVPTPLPNSSQDFDASHNETVTIKVTTSSTYDGFVQDVRPAIKPITGSYTVVVAPHESWHVSVSAAAIYSFVKAPQYAVTTTNSQLTISQSTNDYNKVSGAAMLNLTADHYYGEFFQPHWQIGIVPDSSKLAFLLGGGFTAGPVTEFSLGVIYQKTTELASGLSVGQTVSSTQALKTDTKFKPGLYLSIGVKVPTGSTSP